MIQITADMFSGRPNPIWTVQADEAREILAQVEQNRSIVAGIDDGYQGLGYRGLIVEALSDNTVKNSTCRLGSGFPAMVAEKDWRLQNEF